MSSNPQSSPSLPPANNPFLTAYESFLHNTPLVTRYVLSSLVVSYIASLLFMENLSFALSNIPYFSIYKFELYRIIVSPFLCDSILSLVFAYLSFVDTGKRLEFALGSVQFAWLLLTIGCVTNIIVIILALFLSLASGSSTSGMFISSYGIWIILFGIISIECSQASSHSQRRLFFTTVPTLYYPVILCFLFSLIGGLSISYFISVAVGYAYGYGYLDRTKLTSSRCKTWEDTILTNFTQREGWVYGHNAPGNAAELWNNQNDDTPSTSAGNIVPSRIAGFFNGNNNNEGGSDANSTNSSFMSGAGRTLGSAGTGATSTSGPSRRTGGNVATSADADAAAIARSARLKALESRGSGGTTTDKGQSGGDPDVV